MKDWIAKRKSAIGLVVAIIVAMLVPILQSRQMTAGDWGDHTRTVLIGAVIVALFIEFVLKKRKP